MDRMLTMGNSWYVKAKRAQTADDDETWNWGGVVTTLNAFDQGDTRATVVIVFSHTQGLDAQPSETVSPTLRLNGGGQAVAVDTYNGAIGELSQTLRSGGGKGSLSSDNYGATMIQSQVRRLTPMECERLQGFPDGWTEGQSDSARYRQMGNAVAVPCVEWIVQRLVETDAAK